jgi:hypothetical protein
LQQTWVRRLAWHYNQFNYLYLRSRLSRPLVTLLDSSGLLGKWDATTRTIGISVFHILEHSWESVLDTLRHEMAHQYVHEVLGLPGAPPHGEPFREASKLLRCDPAAAASQGSLKSLDASSDERDKVLGRIRDLLALATSPNEHEAASAMRMANKYLLKYNLDLAALEGERHYSYRYLGRSIGRVHEYQSTLGHILQEHFFVLVIWTFSYDPFRDVPGSILQVSGTPENIEVAEYVYNYVMNLTEPLWRAHRKLRESSGGTKLQYLAGLLRGLQAKLDLQRRELKDEHGLVWVGDKGLTDYYEHLHPKTTSSSNWGASRSADFHAGMEDGRKLTIHRGIGSESRNRGKLLPGTN